MIPRALLSVVPVNFRNRWDRAVEIFRSWRCGPLACIAIAGLLLHEEFPFSHFPMYSSFTNKVTYVYLATALGEPLATNSSAGMHTANLKKVFDSDLQKERKRVGARGKVTDAERRATAARVLATVRRSHSTQADSDETNPARLYEVNIVLHEHRFDRTTTLLAEAP